MTKMLQVTWTVTALVEPYGFTEGDHEDAEMQRAVEMVGCEPAAYAAMNGSNTRISCEWVEVPE